MKHFLIIFFISFTYSFSQNTNEKIDLTKVSNEKTIIKLKDEKIIKLESDLLYYRIKEDYFSVALADQSNRFALIVGGLFGLLALVSFGVFRYEQNRLIERTEKQLMVQAQEFKKQTESFLSLEKDLRKTSANNYLSISQKFESENEWVEALSFYLCSARENSRIVELISSIDSDKENKEKGSIIEFVLGNLEDVIICLNKIKGSNQFKQELNSNIKNIKENLCIVEKIDSENLKDLTSEIRICIKNYLK